MRRHFSAAATRKRRPTRPLTVSDNRDRPETEQCKQGDKSENDQLNLDLRSVKSKV